MVLFWHLLNHHCSLKLKICCFNKINYLSTKSYEASVASHYILLTMIITWLLLFQNDKLLCGKYRSHRPMQIYCIFMCIFLMANFIRSFNYFSSNDKFGYELFFKLLWSIFWWVIVLTFIILMNRNCVCTSLLVILIDSDALLNNIAKSINILKISMMLYWHLESFS